MSGDTNHLPSLELQVERIAEAYTPPATGRHAALTDSPAIQELLTAIRNGNYLDTACKISGLARSTVYEWLKRGEAGEGAYARFWDAVKSAEAMAEAEDVANVRLAGKSGPQYWAASMTYLERRHPDRWGKRQDESSGPKVVVQIGVKDSDVSISVLSPETFAPNALNQGAVND